MQSFMWPRRAELAVMLTDRRRNSHPELELARHRQADQRAVVSGLAADRGSGPDDAPRMLGDIAIAYQTTRAEPMTSKSRSTIISATWRSMASCI